MASPLVSSNDGGSTPLTIAPRAGGAPLPLPLDPYPSVPLSLRPAPMSVALSL